MPHADSDGPVADRVAAGLQDLPDGGEQELIELILEATKVGVLAGA